MDTTEHGGGDTKLIEAFLKAIVDPEKDQPLTNARLSLESHFMAFSAEQQNYM